MGAKLVQQKFRFVGRMNTLMNCEREERDENNLVGQSKWNIILPEENVVCWAHFTTRKV